MRSEWTKLRSIRSTHYSVAVLIVATVGIAGLVCAIQAGRWDQMTAQDREAMDLTSLSLNGWFLGQLAVGVLGVLAVTAEYGSRMIRTTFAAVPQRRVVILSKMTVVAVFVWALATVVSFASFFLGQALLDGTGYAPSLADPGVARAVFGAGLYATAVAVMGLGLGTVCRSTAAAISALFAILFVPPILGDAIGGSVREAIQQYAPLNAGAQMISVDTAPEMLGPWTGLGLLALYAAATVAAGLWMVHHRDA
jgi:ABC-2 type transport system permease protein